MNESYDPTYLRSIPTPDNEPDDHRDFGNGVNWERSEEDNEPDLENKNYEEI